MAITSEEQADVAQQFNDRKRQDSVMQAAAKPPSSPMAVARAGGGQVLTAQLLQWAWRLYIPSFTLTSLYIWFHLLCRYVFHFQSFCRASEGSPLAGVGQLAAAAGGAGGVKIPGSGGASEGMWIALGVGSIAPLAIAVAILMAVVDTAEHPMRNFGCAAKAGAIGVAHWSKDVFADKFLTCVITR